MINRWGRQLQQKGTVRTSGQNNINININFNALKDSKAMPNPHQSQSHTNTNAQIFTGKKLDNFIQITNDKNNIQQHNNGRPNVSMQTLKRKKNNSGKQQDILDYQLHRKKSKSRIAVTGKVDIGGRNGSGNGGNDGCITPEKIGRQRQKQRHLANSKSMSKSKKSTKKRSAKSYDNLKKYYDKNDRNSPRITKNINKQQQQMQKFAQNSHNNSKDKSRSKSKSKSKSNKKLIKNSSKSKITTNSTNTKAKNTAHNSKKQHEQQRPFLKSKKPSLKKTQKILINSNKQEQPLSSHLHPASSTLNVNMTMNINKKSSTDKLRTKKQSVPNANNNNNSNPVQNIKTKTPKSYSKQKQSKSLKRMPLFYYEQQEQQQKYDQSGTYKKIQRQAHVLLYDDEQSNAKIDKKSKRDKKDKQQSHFLHKNAKNQQSAYKRYLKNAATFTDLRLLTQSAITIQKHWRGYKIRNQFINQLNLMNHRIQLTRNKIANLDPKFWDDGQSNSILKAQDAQSLHSSHNNNRNQGQGYENEEQQQQLSQLDSQIQKPRSISEHSIPQNTINKDKNNNNKILKNNQIIQFPQQKPSSILPAQNNVSAEQHHKQMLQRIIKLQQHLKLTQAKAVKLQQQNKQLKNNLHKVSTNSNNVSNNNSNNNSNSNNKNNNIIVINNSNNGSISMQQSMKSDQSWEIKKRKYDNDPFFQQDRIDDSSNMAQSQQFQLRLPKKIVNQITEREKNKKNNNNKQKSNNDKISDQSDDSNPNSDKFRKFKGRIQSFQCASPKNNTIKVNIDSGILQLFQKKQDNLKQTFDKKVVIYDRMLNDSIVSPRTYSLKKNQLQQKFRQQAEIIKARKQQAARVAKFIQQISAQQGRNVIIQKQQKHDDKKQKNNQKQQKQVEIKPSIIRQKNHIIEDYGNMNLNSHRSKSQSEQADFFQSSLQSQKSNKQSIFKKVQPSKQQQNQVQLAKQIDQKNGQAIRIFHQISDQHASSSDQPQQQPHKNTKNPQQQSSSPLISYPPPPKPASKGLQTTLLFIKQYCVSFVQFIQSSQQHKQQFITSICTPIQYNNLQFLKAYRTTLSHQADSSYNSQEKQYIYPYFRYIYPKQNVISREAFMEFNEQYQKLQGDCEFKAQRQFFLNSLLDAFNQSLDYKRPCSIYGQPPTWQSQSRTLKNHSLKSQHLPQQQFLASQKFNQICGGAIAKVIQWSTSLCGFIPQSPQMQNVIIQQQQINHIREARIALMLEKDLLENQENILDSNIEQTEVKLGVAEGLYLGIIEEVWKEIIDIKGIKDVKEINKDINNEKM